jgi:hypothetical protein
MTHSPEARAAGRRLVRRVTRATALVATGATALIVGWLGLSRHATSATASPSDRATTTAAATTTRTTATTKPTTTAPTTSSSAPVASSGGS